MAIASDASRMDLEEDLKGQHYQVRSCIGVRLVDFLLQRIEDVVIAAGLDVIFQPLQRHTNDIAVMQPGSYARLRA